MSSAGNVSVSNTSSDLAEDAERRLEIGILKMPDAPWAHHCEEPLDRPTLPST
jgi:hypothetical protein